MYGRSVTEVLRQLHEGQMDSALRAYSPVLCLRAPGWWWDVVELWQLFCIPKAGPRNAEGVGCT